MSPASGSTRSASRRLVAGAVGAGLALRLLAGGRVGLERLLVIGGVEAGSLEGEGACAQDLLDLLPALVLLEGRVGHPLKHLEAAALGTVVLVKGHCANLRKET